MTTKLGLSGVMYINPIPFAPVIPYPLRAAKIGLDVNLFGFWWKPSFFKFDRSERQKAEGDIQWYARWLWFQISYSRWL